MFLLHPPNNFKIHIGLIALKCDLHLLGASLLNLTPYGHHLLSDYFDEVRKESEAQAKDEVGLFPRISPFNSSSQLNSKHLGGRALLFYHLFISSLSGDFFTYADHYWSSMKSFLCVQKQFFKKHIERDVKDDIPQKITHFCFRQATLQVGHSGRTWTVY